MFHMTVSGGTTWACLAGVTRKLGSPPDGCQAERHNQAKDWKKERFIICSK